MLRPTVPGTVHALTSLNDLRLSHHTSGELAHTAQRQGALGRALPPLTCESNTAPFSPSSDPDAGQPPRGAELNI